LTTKIHGHSADRQFKHGND